MKDNFRILVIKPGQKPVDTQIPYTLKSMQQIVVGYIETVPLGNDVLLICNEEGKLLGLEPNRVVGNDVICGDFFICASDEEDFDSLNDEQTAFYTEQFSINRSNNFDIEL